MNNISNRYKRMDDFIQRWKQIALENPNVSFDDVAIQNAIYSDLVRIGVSDSERKHDLSHEGVFQRWVDDFASVSNIDVFVADDWQYFCQFINRKSEVVGPEREAIKVYIPLDRMHVENGAKMIFSFLAKNNIAHASKVGKNIRFDDIVVRLSSEEDARQLLSFVDSVPYLKEGMLEPNPFAFNNQSIALVCDRKLSYNSTISSLISAYLSQKKSNNDLSRASLTDFVRFSYNYYDERFERFEKLDETMERFGIIDRGNGQETNSAVINTKEVINLFLASMQPMFYYRNYAEEFRKRRENISFKKEVLELQHLRAKRKMLENHQGTSSSLDDTIVDDSFFYNQILMETVNTMTEKYNKKRALSSIDTYLLTGSASVLTRDNDIRTRITSSNFRNYFNSLFREHDVSCKDYYSMMLLDKGKEADYLKNAVLDTYDKYDGKCVNGKAIINGKNLVASAISKIVVNGDFGGITRDNNNREQLQKHVLPEEVLKIMQSKTNMFTERKSLNEVEVKMLGEAYLSSVLDERKNKINGKGVA
ncbi:MAG: hypothetical protein J6A52_04725 [Bacilli bacterium]|nr:hypothetical protein [Bacilli bacterium]